MAWQGFLRSETWQAGQRRAGEPFGVRPWTIEGAQEGGELGAFVIGEIERNHQNVLAAAEAEGITAAIEEHDHVLDAALLACVHEAWPARDAAQARCAESAFELRHLFAHEIQTTV